MSHPIPQRLIQGPAQNPPRSKRRPLIFTLLCCLLSTATSVAALALYHHQVIVPRQRIGLVDLPEVYRLKETQFTQQLTQARGEDDRQAALNGAKRFASRLPQALAELPQECGCLVLMRQGVVAPVPDGVDLTSRLQQKLDTP